MLIKQKIILIVVTSFLVNGCSSSSPTVVRNGGTETTQVNGTTTASMRHMSCMKKGRLSTCADANGNMIMNESPGIFSEGMTISNSQGTITNTKRDSKAETAIDSGVKVYPYIKGIIKLTK